MLLLLAGNEFGGAVIDAEIIALAGLYSPVIELASYQGVNVSANTNITRDKGWFVGEAKELVIHVLDANGVPIDLTGASLHFAMRKTVRLKSHYREQGALAFEKTTASGGLVVEGDYTNDSSTNEQRVRVTIAPADTTNLEPGTYAHALKHLGNQAIISEGTAELLLAAVR
jgi:hypothetical protein